MSDMSDIIKLKHFKTVALCDLEHEEWVTREIGTLSNNLGIKSAYNHCNNYPNNYVCRNLRTNHWYVDIVGVGLFYCIILYVYNFGIKSTLCNE
jgi:hypothetical protein